MRSILHILTRPDDALAHSIVARQEESGEVAIVIVDLTAPAIDYSALLEKIFAADSVQSW